MIIKYSTYRANPDSYKLPVAGEHLPAGSFVRWSDTEPVLVVVQPEHVTETIGMVHSEYLRGKPVMVMVKGNMSQVETDHLILVMDEPPVAVARQDLPPKFKHGKQIHPRIAWMKRIRAGDSAFYHQYTTDDKFDMSVTLPHPLEHVYGHEQVRRIAQEINWEWRVAPKPPDFGDHEALLLRKPEFEREAELLRHIVLLEKLLGVGDAQ